MPPTQLQKTLPKWSPKNAKNIKKVTKKLQKCTKNIQKSAPRIPQRMLRISQQMLKIPREMPKHKVLNSSKSWRYVARCIILQLLVQLLTATSCWSTPPPRFLALIFGQIFDQIFVQVFDPGFLDPKIQCTGLLGRRNIVYRSTGQRNLQKIQNSRVLACFFVY